MKIKILTFHSELNYGANLQAYALKQFLVLNGHDVSFINFTRHRGDNNILSFIRKWIGKNPRLTYEKVKENILGFSSELNKKNIFKKFQNEFIPQNEVVYQSLDHLKKSPPNADIYIVGSDQVWSPKIVLEQDVAIYFLNFGSETIRKIAYAASSGGEIFPKEIETNSKKLLVNFNFVGVRENSLVSYLHSIGINNAEWTPDPTFLINWPDHLGFKSKEKLNRIAFFTLNKKNEDRAWKLQSDLKNQPEFQSAKTFDLSKSVVSPFEWIREISKSKLLITDSYHAVLFSIFTHTPVLFLKWGESYKRDERVISILSLFELNDLAVDDFEINEKTAKLLSNLDWSIIDKKVLSLKLIGERFLNKALG